MLPRCCKYHFYGGCGGVNLYPQHTKLNGQNNGINYPNESFETPVEHSARVLGFSDYWSSSYAQTNPSCSLPPKNPGFTCLFPLFLAFITISGFPRLSEFPVPTDKTDFIFRFCRSKYTKQNYKIFFFQLYSNDTNNKSQQLMHFIFCICPNKLQKKDQMNNYMQ